MANAKADADVLGLGCQGRVIKVLNLGFQLVDAIYQRLDLFEDALIFTAENFGEYICYHRNRMVEY